jgi:ketosteroid isomerase-like protein
LFSNLAVPDGRLTTHDVIIDAGIAVERGTYEMTFHPKSGTGADIIDRGKYITVWERQADGSWKISRDMSKPDNPR